MPRSFQSSPLWDPLVAAALLSRLPLPRVPEAAFAHGARAAWAYPVVGMALGTLAYLVSLAGPTPILGAGMAVATITVLSGGLHEDGLADTADGLWGGHDPARRLDIMKDSRIGAYGVLALIFAIGLRWAALVATGPVALIGSAALSRGLMPALMRLPHARDSGLSRRVGQPSRSIAGIAAAIGALILLSIFGIKALPALLCAGVVAAALAGVAHRKIGGQTGDILGAGQQVTEVAILIALAA